VKKTTSDDDEDEDDEDETDDNDQESESGDAVVEDTSASSGQQAEDVRLRIVAGQPADCPAEADKATDCDRYPCDGRVS
jgi:hypothetical protein